MHATQAPGEEPARQAAEPEGAPADALTEKSLPAAEPAEAGPASAAEAAEAAGPESPFLHVRDVRVDAGEGGRRLVIELSRVPERVRDFTLDRPPRLVLDAAGPVAPDTRRLARFAVSDGDVAGVRAAPRGRGLRVVVDLHSARVRPLLRQEGTRLLIELGDGRSAEVPTAAPEANGTLASAVVLERAAAIDLDAAAPEPAAAIDLDRARPRAAAAIDLDAAPAEPAAAIDPEAAPPRPAAIDLDAAPEGERVALLTPAAAAATEPAPAEAPPEASAPAGEERVRVETAPRPLKPRVPLPPPTQVYTGQRISLDLKDADIQNVLRVLADVSQLNIIATDDVKGRVTLHLTDVPWDQALDLVLRSNRLEKTQEGNVVRISTVARLKEEREALRAAQDAEKELEPLRVRYVRVNYARADDVLVEKVKGVLTDRGSVTFDDRTNTIIVRDIARGCDDAAELIRELDTQSPQVLIEANIVEATEDFARGLGVQWGYVYRAGPQTGNPTGVNFPGTIGVGGSGVGAGVPAPSPGSGVPRLPVPFIADFPVPPGFGGGFGPGAGSAIDLALGSIDGTQSLTARLTALEEQGKGKVVSRPRVITMNNVAATIQSLTILRVKLPSTGTVINTGAGGAAGTATTATEKINTGITLVVTPQVSSDGYVLMSIYAKSSQPDFSRTVDGIPNEVSREANSNVLIPTGETVVLGGIYRNTADDRESGVPYLRRVPVLGWLFKRVLTNNHHEELLVFLTPRILSSGTAALPAAERLWEERRQGG
jgi:type IV pilus assembly protein PilQ